MRFANTTDAAGASSEPIEELSFGSSVRTSFPHGGRGGYSGRGGRDNGSNGDNDGNAKRSKRIWLRIVLIVLAAALVVSSVSYGAWMWEHHWRTISVTANGTAYEVSVDTKLGTLLKDHRNFDKKPGRLLDITGGTIDQTGGEPVTVTINGTTVDAKQLDNTPLPENAHIKVTAGGDVTEGYTVGHETVEHGADINLAGSVQLLKQAGKDGEREIWIGKRSHKQVEKAITKQPQDLIVEAVNPRPAGRKVIALTFDDGPSKFSDPILDILKEKGVKATFFDLGQNAIEYATAEKRMIAEGHEVCSHSNSHADLPKLSRDALRAELSAGFANLEKASGTKTKVLRAPYGAFTKQQWEDAHDLIHMNVLWDIDTLDWKRPGEQAIHDAVLNHAHNGAIVLMHDGGGDRSQDVAALPSIIDDLKAQGYEFVTVKQLLEMSGVSVPK
ncbi:polysaccharide deacetylase [Bifidobacterium goeldii]|uniref:Polysaccharide deacetylase n=2 Tax=Bifidobacterium goeldii TaxID=2306975 RepID=A0A430FHB8_9BIFI|nr:polysaccharide deacetylase [Bifidobacterium goeldii]